MNDINVKRLISFKPVGLNVNTDSVLCTVVVKPVCRLNTLSFFFLLARFTHHIRLMTTLTLRI